MTRPTTRHECDRDCGRAPGSCSDCPYIIRPNATTIAAMEEARNGDLTAYSSVEEVMADLIPDYLCECGKTSAFNCAGLCWVGP